MVLVSPTCVKGHIKDESSRNPQISDSHNELPMLHQIQTPWLSQIEIQKFEKN